MAAGVSGSAVPGASAGRCSVIQASIRRHAEGTQPGLCFFDLGADDLITRITDFWPEPYEPPANRANLTERY